MRPRSLLLVIAAVLVLVFLGLLAGLHPWRKDPRPLPRAGTASSKEAPRADAPYVPPRTIDPKLTALVNRDAPMDERISSDISSRIPRVENDNDVPVLVAVLSDPKDDDTVRNEVANLLRRSNSPGLMEALIGVLDNPEEKARFRSFATQHLGQLDPPNDSEQHHRQFQKLQQLLGDRHVEVRREALLALVRKKDPAGVQKAVEWLAVPSPEPKEDVRDLAIRCVHDLDMREHIPTIRKYLRDPNQVVRIAAIVALSEWGDEEGRGAFKEAAKSDVVRLRRAGEAAIKRLDSAGKR